MPTFLSPNIFPKSNAEQQEGENSHMKTMKNMHKGGRSQDGGGVGWGEHFLPYKFIKRAFKSLVNFTKQLLNAGRGHQAPRKATQVFKRK